MLKDIKKIHFVGIGGAGMSAIAKVLLQMGYIVSGSDLTKSETTAKLEKIGAHIYLGHNEENLQDSQAIVISTAIPETNPEVKLARKKQIPVFHRADIVAYLMLQYKGIAVAGAHGKTTTTSMIAVMLEHAGVDPTVIIGGEVDYLNGNAKLGSGQYLVAEADESDGSFLKFSPHIAVVTNIENDHMDFYKTMENVLDTFKKFLHKLPPSIGLGIVCFDNENIRNLVNEVDRPYISYGIDHTAQYMARNLSTQGATTTYDVYHNEQLLGSIKINVPGRHNVGNSLAAVIVGLNIGLTFQEIAEGLAHFQGAKRRFQTKAKINGVWIIDDYAHHPTEIATTLLAARQTEPNRLICVFQPHRYSRTAFLRNEFGSAFQSSDILVLTDVYSAGEAPIPGITGEVLKEEVERQTSKKVIYIADKDKIARYLSQIVEPGDLVITMGAGNVYCVGEELIESLVQKQ
ncbi:UDP-N-acetylmuramate--L-alanine ligase [Pelosinus fermentans]|uniref:UDP-N-acetylmuramate--L-alanine ligase n=1 Tax=Pelosinus fermentans JBW45 TaxID=1192197 RepID=I8U416_9FIRM|nr:UDP-N-acetylmuramate--L-alanine ligase [Pelosinus fermentans]AJQ27377.1 UDP-N-acetylmuramate--L-alanine ligase [Pelosinus fermentans JBW45]